VDDSVRRERHAAVGDFIGALLELAGGTFGRELAELGEVDVFFALFDVIGEPPANRLHVGVPRVAGVVRVAVVAGRFQKVPDFRGGRMLGQNVVLAGGRTVIFRLAYELNSDEKHQ